ncbi:hypothetical protein Tco_0525240 [Tanacetum coccineum]
MNRLCKENSLITQEASGSLEDLEIIQEEDTHPSIDTSLNHEEDDLEIDEPQSAIIPIRSTLWDLGELANYKAALLDPESDKWLNAMNVRMLQKPQGNGQNRTNTDTGTDRVQKSEKFLAKAYSGRAYWTLLAYPYDKLELVDDSKELLKALFSVEAQVMAISIISVSSDSSEDGVGTPAGRVILFGTIPTTILDTTPSVTSPTTHIDTIPIPTVSPIIPPSPNYTPTSPDYTPTSPDYSPASDTEFDPSEDLSSDHIPPLPATLPFLSSIDDSSDSDTPDTPPSPTHGTPFTETTLST